MMRALLVTIAFCVAGAAAAAEQQPVSEKEQKTAADKVKVARRPATSFGYLDTNKDARITREEAKADWAVSTEFDGADTNRDGLLDREEFGLLLQRG